MIFIVFYWSYVIRILLLMVSTNFFGYAHFILNFNN